MFFWLRDFASQFVAVLKQLSEHCEFGQSLSDTIGDRLVCGLRSKSILKQLLSAQILFRQKKQVKCRKCKLQMQKSGASAWRLLVMNCRNCGKKGQIEHACKNKKTQQSKNTGPKKKYHQKFKQKQVNQMENTQQTQSKSWPEDEDALCVLSVSEDERGYPVTPFLDGKPICMQVDRGAAVSLVSETTFKDMLSHRSLSHQILHWRPTWVK